MTRSRALGAAVGVVLWLALPVTAAPGSVTGPTVACAADGPQAALVVDNGARVQRLCVALDAESVTGIHLVELAADQHALSYALGFGGQAVCRIDGVGPTGGDCFADYPDFWGYWHGDGDGGWIWAGSGAASSRVGDGDVEGWVWGSGDTASTHPAPPATNLEDVCGEAEPPAPEPEPDDDDRPAGGGAGGGGDEPGLPPSPTPSPGDVAPHDDEQRRGRDRAERESTPAGEPSRTTSDDEIGDDAELRAAGASVPADDGPPAALFLATVLGIALAGAGWWRLRRSAGGRAS